MIAPVIKLFTAGIGTLLVMIFVFGLAESITSGFAGFWGVEVVQGYCLFRDGVHHCLWHCLCLQSLYLAPLCA